MPNLTKKSFGKNLTVPKKNERPLTWVGKQSYKGLGRHRIGQIEGREQTGCVTNSIQKVYG